MAFEPVRKPSAKPSSSPRQEERRKQLPESVPTTRSRESTIPRYLRSELEQSPTPTPAPKSPATPTSGAAPTTVAGDLGRSEALAPQVASRFSQAYGQDLSQVRVHPDSPKPGAIGARAFTVGNDIAFAPGTYQPGSSAGQRLLGHELAHVVQQSGQKPTLQGEGLSNDSPEQEADRAAAAALSGEPVPPLSSVGPGTVQLQAAGAPAAAAAPGNPKASQKKAQPGEIDLSRGMLDASTVRVDENGRAMARLGNLAAGELELVQGEGGYSTKGQGAALLLSIPSLDSILGGRLVLVVRIENNVITGHAALGKPGRAVPRNDSSLLGALGKDPEALGLEGLSKLGIKSLHNALENGTLKLGAESVDFTLSGFVTGSGQLHFENDQIRFGGQAEVKLPGGSGGKLQVNYSPETGLSGETHLEVSIGKVSGGADARLNQGVLDIQGTASYAGDQLKGTITLLATDAATARDITTKDPQAGGLPTPGAEGTAGAGAGAATPGAAGPQAKPGPRAFCGWGELDFSLTEWLTGRVKVVVGSTGEATVRGEIAPPKEIILFEQKEWTKSLLKAEARALYGLPVVGNVFVFANVGLEALATIGPGKLYNIKLSGQYSTDKRADKELNLQASLNISAFAGLRLRAEGGAGIELLDHDIKAGVGVWALAGVRGYVEATPTIGYRQKAGAAGEFYIKGHMDLAAQPFLGLGGDLFVEVDSPWWSPLPDDKWTWPLGSIEYPLPGEFGIGADVEHVLGSKQWPEVKFTEVDFDSGRFMSDLLSQSAPGKSKGGEDNKPAKWNEGGAGGAPEGAKGGPGGKSAPAPAKAPAAGGKKQNKKDASTKPAKNKPGKEKPGKDKLSKDKATGAPSQVGEPVNFSAKGESYRLWLQMKGKSATLLVTNPRRNAVDWIAAQELKVGNLPKDAQARAHALGAEARPLAAAIDQQADRVASGTGDKATLQKANDQIKKDERRLAALLRQLAELSGGEKSDGSIGESVPFRGGGESHKLYFVRKGKDAVLMVASTPSTVEHRLADFEARLQGGKERLGFFSDEVKRDKARQLLTRARNLAKTADQQADQLADQLVRAHQQQAATPENEKLVKQEHSLASTLAELYEIFGEHAGDTELDMRATYAGAAGAGELSFKRKSTEGKTAHVVASGPISGHMTGALRGQVLKELDVLEQQITEQKVIPPSEDLKKQMGILRSKTVESETAANKHLKAGGQGTPKPPPEIQSHLDESAQAASQIAHFKRVGPGELVERAVTELADEKMSEGPHVVFSVSAELRQALESDAAHVKQENASASENAPSGKTPSAKTARRLKAGTGIVPNFENPSRTGVGQDYLTAVTTSSTGSLVNAVGTYEEIRQAIVDAGGAFGPELVQAIHGQMNLKRSRKGARVEFKLKRLGQDKSITKDRAQFLNEITVLFYVEMARATAAWAFPLNKLLAANTPEEAAAAFETVVFPHAKEGFMREYRKFGPAVFDQASVQLFKDLQVEFQKTHRFEDPKHVFLAAEDVRQAVDAVKKELYKLYDRVFARGNNP